LPFIVASIEPLRGRSWGREQGEVLKCTSRNP
jgi:hypothetical protein